MEISCDNVYYGPPKHKHIEVMIKKLKRSSQAEALKVIEEEVHHLPDSKPQSVRKVRQRPDDQFDWYFCKIVPKDFAETSWVELYHYHDGFDLMKPGEKLKTAVNRYQQTPNLDNSCSARIEAIRQTIREKKDEAPIFFEVKSPNLLDHIDGFHREMAWLLENKTEPLTAYVAFAKN